jgi:hypothetical protein
VGGSSDTNVTPKSARFLIGQDEFTGKLLVDLPDDSKGGLRAKTITWIAFKTRLVFRSNLDCNTKL